MTRAAIPGHLVSVYRLTGVLVSSHFRAHA